jgi:hypothetical protein
MAKPPATQTAALNDVMNIARKSTMDRPPGAGISKPRVEGFLRQGHCTLLSLVTRGARFFLEAELLRYCGEPIRAFIEKRLTLVTTGFLAVVVGGFLLANYVL